MNCCIPDDEADIVVDKEGRPEIVSMADIEEKIAKSRH